MDLVGRKLAHFSVEAKLGEGGMGVVYRAVDEKLRRTVALKVLPERFSQEVEARRRLFPHLSTAAAQCALLPDLATTANQVMYRSTVLSVRAHLLLGQALEAKGDNSGACEAYGFVKDAKPRSVTLEKARARARALRCF